MTAMTSSDRRSSTAVFGAVVRRCILLSITATLATAHGADDLDRMVDPKVKLARRQAIYARLKNAEFPAIARRLAEVMRRENPLRGDAHLQAGPLVEEFPRPPAASAETTVPVSDGLPVYTTGTEVTGVRGGFSGVSAEENPNAWSLWYHHTSGPKTTHSEGYLELVLAIVEDRTLGGGRYQPLQTLSSHLSSSRQSQLATVPPLEDVVARLGRIAHDPEEERYVRLCVIELLFRIGDPNDFLDEVIALTNQYARWSVRAQEFCNRTPTGQKRRFTPENRRKYLEHAFALLAAIDDGGSGRGYQLALEIGRFVDSRPFPGHDRDAMFAPDQSLPEYQTPSGLSERFFQDTVNNARAWWQEHRDRL